MPNGLNEVYFDLLYDFIEGINKHYPKLKDGNINYMKINYYFFIIFKSKK